MITTALSMKLRMSVLVILAACCFQSMKATPLADDVIVGVCAAAGGLYAAYHRNMSRFHESRLQALKRQKATMEIDEYRKQCRAVRAQYQRHKRLSTRAAGLTTAGVVVYALFRIWLHYQIPAELRQEGVSEIGFASRLFACIDEQHAGMLAERDRLYEESLDLLLLRRVQRAQDLFAQRAMARA